MPENGKAFFNVIAMSEAFRKFETSMTGKQPASGVSEGIVSMALWQVRAQMATAQQLCNVSEQLKKLNEVLLSHGGTKVSE